MNESRSFSLLATQRPYGRRAAAQAMMNAHQKARPQSSPRYRQFILEKAIGDLHTIVLPVFNITSLAITDLKDQLVDNGLYRHMVKRRINDATSQADHMETRLFGDWRQMEGTAFYLDFLDQWQQQFQHDLDILRWSLQRAVMRQEVLDIYQRWAAKGQQ